MAQTPSNPSRNRRPASPKRVRYGIKLNRKQPIEPTTWPAVQLSDWLDRTFDEAARDAGFEYARLGQTISLDIESGVVQAVVQGRAGRPYKTALTFNALGAAEWDRVISALVEEALVAVKIQQGAWPDGVDEHFAAHQAPLIGNGPVATCTCGDDGPCKHEAAVAHLLIERLEDDPLTLLTLHGMEPQRVLERLVHSRAIQASGAVAAHGGVSLDRRTMHNRPLEDALTEYWRPGPELAAVQASSPPHHVSHALLRRLGPSPLPGRFPLVGLLASVYDAVSEEAANLRDGAAEQSPDEPSA